MLRANPYLGTLNTPYFRYGVYFFFSLWFVLTWIQTSTSPLTSFYPADQSDFKKLMDGTANRPYIQRLLVPVLTRTIISAIPAPYDEKLRSSLPQIPKVQKELRRLGWDAGVILEHVVSSSIVVFLFFSTVLILDRLLMLLYRSESHIRMLQTCMSFLLLPPVFETGPHYIYDLPTIFFLIAGMLLLYQKRWTFYYIVFFLGCLNKETMLFMSVAFFAFYTVTIKRNQLILHMLLHMVIISFVYFMIVQIYGNNPGTNIEFHFHANIHSMLQGYSLSGLAIFGISVWLLAYDFRSVPRLFRMTAFIAIPFSVTWLLFGILTELRAVYEIIFIVNLFIVHSIFHKLIPIVHINNDSYKNQGMTHGN